MKCAVSGWILSLGFTHVSDDDYARVTIAQAFAHAPHLDPSGTSWLPFPFWLNGAVMMVLGRSLAVARGVAWASGVAGALLVYWALLGAKVQRWVAWWGVTLAMCAPWSVWLGVATVPEALCACLMVAATLTLAGDGARGATGSRARLYGAVALLTACLTRYEAWPVAAVFALACGMRAARNRQAADFVPALVAVLGPLAWMAWNAHAHGDPIHFLARVAAYRARLTGGESSDAWSLYPDAFARGGPLTLALAAVGAPALVLDPVFRRRWAWPLLAMVALIAFLIEGDLHNGAPTHHPERALLAVFWVGSAFGLDGVRALAVRFVWGHSAREAWLVGAGTALVVAWGMLWPSRLEDYPAKSATEDRREQVARGVELRERGVIRFTVTPCGYEYFALLAAFEAPERVTVKGAGASGKGSEPGGASPGLARVCPRVVEP